MQILDSWVIGKSSQDVSEIEISQEEPFAVWN